MLPRDDADFLAEADWVIAEQRARGSRLVVWTVLAAFAALVTWAAFAEIDEVTRGVGKVIPSRQVQVVQSLDGGIVSEIQVSEGDQVEKNQLLVRIDPTRFVSSLRENRTQYLALLAKAARLRAIAEDKPFEPPAEVVKEAPHLIEQERALYEATQAETRAAVAIARQQLDQRRRELDEVKARRDQAARSHELTLRELQLTEPLAASGAVADVELLRLRREVARYQGERDSSAAQIPRLEAAIIEATRKIEEVELTKRNRARNELTETMITLGALGEESVALADRVKQSEIRSPVRGTVKQLLVNTIGGVVQPGQEVVEIVPADDALVLEARIAPRDIAFLRPGQRARVKFTAYDFAVYGGLDARLVQIGADTETDEQGNAYYRVKLRTDRNHIGEERLPIIPGMVAEVDILTGKKSILTYLLKPVLRAKETALRER
ncbi:MAG: HlyD family type I secretion periplasmic adaptor subunit [Gammaproteobacteria bacterium]